MLFTYLLPSVVLIIPLYLLMVQVGLANTIASLVIAYTTFALPYALWLLRSFMAGIPEDLESAALVDGASRIGAFVDVILPQALPGIISTALFTFILAWNEYLYALVLVNSDAARPLTTGVMNMLITSFNIEWSLLMAASVDDEPAAHRHLHLPAGLPDQRLRRRRREGLSAAKWLGVSFEKVRKAFGSRGRGERARPDDRRRRVRQPARPFGLRQDDDAPHARRVSNIRPAGVIRIGERVVNDVPPAQRDIAMVFQSYALYPHMTVAENIAYPLKKRRVPKAERAGHGEAHGRAPAARSR